MALSFQPARLLLAALVDRVSSTPVDEPERIIMGDVGERLVGPEKLEEFDQFYIH